MSLLPWDDWIYHLTYKRNEVNQLHTTAVGLQDQIDSQIDVFNGWLQQYQTLVAGNAALVIVTNILTYKDLEYKNFTVQVDAVENPPVGFVPVSAASMVDELAGGVMVLKAIFNLGKLVKNGVFGTSEALPEAASQDATEALVESGAEAGVEASAESAGEITTETVGEGVAEGVAEGVITGASLGALGALGIGIFAAVGIDVIFGVINGARENSQLDDAINRLQTAVNKCQTYYNTVLSKQGVLEGKIVAEEKRFQDLIAALAKVSSPVGSGINNQPTFQYTFDTTTANAPQFIGSMRSALAQYGAFAQIRNNWVVAEEKNPNITKDAFLAAESVVTTLDSETLSQYFTILATYSDSMAAKQGD
jgi:hypothetical protein